MTVAPRSKIVAFLLALAAVTLVACGGGSKDSGSGGGGGGDDSAKKAEATALIKKIVGPNAKAKSARIDGTVDVDIKGVPRYKGTSELTASGVYDLPSGADAPDVDIDVGLVLNNHAIGGALVVKDSTGYIRLGSTGYKLPGAISQKIVAPASEQENGLTKAASMFYINPQKWQKNAIVAGDEDIAGVPTTHITAELQPKLVFADIARLFRLLTSLRVTEAVGLPLAVTPKARRVLARSTTLAKGEVWVGKSDNVLRKAHLVGKLVVAKGDRRVLGGMTSATIDAVITIDEVGEAKAVKAPTQLGSYDDLQLTLDALGESIRNELKGKK
jgi:hypothetical protein